MIETLIKRVGQRAGIEIRRYRPFSARRAQRLQTAAIASVIDVGANAGWYGAELRASGYRRLIVSFEPLSNAFSELARIAAADGAWECHNMALGDTDAETTIHVASNPASSSLLAMSDELRRQAPDVSYVGHERVRVRRLDSVAYDVPPPALLKVDVQGYEDRVLRGAERILEKIELIECELSIAHLYDGQPSFQEMIGHMSNLGFEIVDLDPFYYDTADGRPLSIDAMFARNLVGSAAASHGVGRPRAG